MNIKISKPVRLRQLLTASMALVAFVSALAVMPGSAAAAGCRAISPVQNVSGGGRTGTEQLTIPYTSTCKDINVRNIVNTKNSNDNCATFNVALYPSAGGTIYTQKKYACSRDPDGSGPKNGPLVVLASDVYDGTKYRVFYDWETEVGGPRHNFQVVD